MGHLLHLPPLRYGLRTRAYVLHSCMQARGNVDQGQQKSCPPYMGAPYMYDRPTWAHTSNAEYDWLETGLKVAVCMSAGQVTPSDVGGGLHTFVDVAEMFRTVMLYGCMPLSHTQAK